MSNDPILEELSQFATLNGVIPWAMARHPRAEFVDVIVQDEFHHDVVVRVSDRVFAVFETS
jgi:hypothetical protein